jgi:gliding motility-associated-like protein
MLKKFLILLAIFIAGIVSDGFAQADTAFWFAAPDLQGNIPSGPGADRPIFLRISASGSPADVVISQPANPSFSPVRISIPANGSRSIDLTLNIAQIENDATNTVMKKGLLIQSTAVISCYYDIVNTRNGDIFALKGKNALGTRFTVPFQMSFNNRTTEANYNDFVIVATEDNTSVIVNPKTDLVGHPAGVSFPILLNRGETYVCRAATNAPFQRPGGTLVTSNNPISISIKEDLLQYPGFGCADTGGDQLISDDLAGNEFIVLSGRFTTGNPDYYYVFATENNTIVKVNNVIVKTLNAGEYYNGLLSAESCFVETSGPSQLLHISGVGCEVGLAIIPSIRCTGSPKVNITRASTPDDENFYLNILAPKDIINDFTLNGDNSLLNASMFSFVNGSSNLWMYARILVTAATAGIGGTVTVENKLGKFHAGVIQGGLKTGTGRFGYFSDFSINSVFLSDPKNPSIPISNSMVVCNNGVFALKATNKQATTFTWKGPNGFSSSGDELLLNNFKSIDTGKYTITTSGVGCGNASKSIILEIDEPIADFTFTSNGCEKDSIKFTTSPTAGVRWIWDFGNGKKLDTNSAVIRPVVLNATGDLPIQLTVGSIGGCFSDIKTKTISLSSKPLAAYSIPVTTCVNDEIVFEDKSTIVTGKIVKWSWNLNDGNGFSPFTNNVSQKKRYNTFGNKQVSLFVESQTGCKSDTFQMASFVVNPLPKPGFINPEVCLNDKTAQFMDTTSSADGFNNFSYTWNFNAGAIPVSNGPIFTSANITEKNPAVQYNEANNYVVKLIVNSRGCIDSVTQAFKVNGANPIPSFDVLKPLELCSKDSIRIENKSTIDFDNVTRLIVYWDQNDLSKKTVDENPLIGKKYAFNYGDFQTPLSKNNTIRLQAFSGDALSCSKTVDKIININASPKVSFSNMPGICLDAQPRQVTEASYDANVPGTFQYVGAGINTAGLFNPTTAGAATHLIKYYYQSSSSVCMDSASNSVTVWPLPTANFNVSALNCEKTSITFTSTSIANAGQLTKWRWNFNDGTSIINDATGNPVNHIFNLYNKYAVQLVVETSNGCISKDKVISVDVHALPRPIFDLPVVCLPEGKAIFTNNTTIPDGTESLMTYLWNFGDANNTNPSLLKNGQHSFVTTGPFDVRLKVTSSNGCVDSLTKKLTTILAQPKAIFSSEDSICLGDVLNFADASKTNDGRFVKWFWDFGDSRTGANQDEIYKYTTSGIKTIQFFAQTDLGCYTDTIKKQVEVFDYPKVSAGPDLFVLDDGKKEIQSTATGRIISYSWTPSLYLSATNVLKPIVVKPQSDVYYTLKVTARGGCSSMDSVKVVSLTLPKPPNTFTPNGDGVNDLWDIKYLDQYPGCVVEVYTTAGQIIYKNTGYTSPWDGTNKGANVAAGTYYYVIDPKNGRKKMAGYVTVWR